ncbi:DUF6531 domain-containing protein [Amycolatopsis sp. YIM 10]|uniref:DUF6531 domain-containing protein n=1 Tax=Amycolatopsis sp. YIM 10 TaxID=2653857 RepID=UPI0012905E4F|nr:DUF6531 domain-containing protein [Amycolatopsis sp. YIM 10]QFU86365.1 Putative deoxyribonuclease RhsC [Amycolatopsis sp. YIM 10]
MSNPLVAQAQSQTTGVTGIGIAESAVDLANGVSDGSWVEAGLGAVGVGLEVLSLVVDPIGTLASYGVSWLIEHVQPLKEALDWLAGDPPVIQSFSETWANVAAEVNAIAGDLGNEVTNGTAGWQGEGAEAYRGAAAEQADALAGAASLADGISAGVMIMGTVVAAVRELVRDLVAELVGKLITWALEAAATLGFATPAIAVQATTAITKTISKISEFIRKLVKTIGNVSPKIRKIIDKLGEIIEKLSKMLRKGGKPGSGTTPSGAKPSTTKTPDTTPNSPDSPDTTPSNTDTTPDGGPAKPDSGSPSSPDSSKPDGSSRPDDPNTTKTPEKARECENDPIDVATGEMVLGQTDVELPGVLSLVLRRTHVSSFRSGELFGRSWASTVDQRVEVDEQGVVYVTDDGMILVYPDPPVDRGALPVAGPRWPLSRSDRGWVVRRPEERTELHFAAGGGGRSRLASIVDDNGNRVDIERDAAGRLTGIRHSGGYRIAVSATERGLVTGFALSGPDETEVPLARFAYDDAERLVEVVNSSTTALRFEYDHAGRITKWTDRNGEWYRYFYDQHGRCVANQGSGGFLNGTFSYDTENRVTRFTDALGHTTTYRLNEARRVIARVDPLGRTSTREWDSHDRLVARTDPLGRTTRFDYDEQGNLVALTYPDGSRSIAEYNEHGRPVTIVGPDGAARRARYDHAGNLVGATDVLGATTRFTYNDRGHLVAVRDALGNQRTIRTDAAGLPVEVVDAAGGRTRYTRDQFGRIVELSDPAGGVHTFRWTVEGRLASRVRPDGARELWRYDAEGNRSEHVDALGQVTRWENTHFDLPASRVGPDGSRVDFEYDADLRLVAVRAADGGTWRYDYDEAGNLVRETDFNGRVLTYRHDEAGQLVERRNGAGEVTTFRRDALGRVVESRRDGWVSTFAFDAAGRLVRAVNPESDVRFERDAAGRVLLESINGRAVRSEYDALGRRRVRMTPTGAVSRWDYDANHQPTSLVSGGHRMTFGHDPAGREIERLLDTGTILAQEWDSRHRLTGQSLSTVSADGAAPASRARLLQQRRYHYRLDGQVAAIGDQLTGDRWFDLDPAGRVTGVSGPGWTESYRYDGVGNIVEGSGDEPGARVHTGTLLTEAGGTRFRYDAQGRVVLRQRKRLSRKPDTWHYEWDADDRLTAVLTPDGTRWSYSYDALGRRIAKRRWATDGSVAEVVEFAWDGTRIVEQVSNGVRAASWNYRPGTFTPVSQVERVLTAAQEWVDDEFYSIVTDLVGSPSELVTPEGDLVWRAHHTVWGAALGELASTASTPLRFPGQYHDAETGLHYNYFRYYDPEFSRYYSQDPLGLRGGLNPHSYVANALTQFDPAGLSACEIEGLEGVSVNRSDNSYSLTHDESGSGIIADLDDDGVLTLMIDRQDGAPFSGRQLFDAAMQHFGDRVNAIEGNWVYGDNLAAFNRRTGEGGMSPEEAAAQTWTGRQAARHGFTNVGEVNATGEPGNYKPVSARFNRP